MAYDEELAERIRKLIGKKDGMSEKKMFGGLAFLVDGNMSVAASGQGGLLVRINPDQSDKLLATTKAEIMEMRGHGMPGWLRVNSADVKSDSELKRWVDLSISYAGKLPPKS